MKSFDELHLKKEDEINFANITVSPGIINVFLDKNTMYASTVKFLLKTAAIHNFLDLSRELEPSRDDPDSSLLMHQQLCKEYQIFTMSYLSLAQRSQKS